MVRSMHRTNHHRIHRHHVNVTNSLFCARLTALIRHNATIVYRNRTGSNTLLVLKLFLLYLTQNLFKRIAGFLVFAAAVVVMRRYWSRSFCFIASLSWSGCCSCCMPPAARLLLLLMLQLVVLMPAAAGLAAGAGAAAALSTPLYSPCLLERRKVQLFLHET